MELIPAVEDLKSVSCLVITANICMIPANDQQSNPNKYISNYVPLYGSHKLSTLLGGFKK
jgi:hypothetical protein